MTNDIIMHPVLNNIPKDFVVELKDKNGKISYFPKLGGLLYLANTMGKYTVECKNTTHKEDEIEFEAKGFIIPNYETLKKLGYGYEIDNSIPACFIEAYLLPTVTHGTANIGNTQSYMHPHMTVLAETRAVARNLRIVTGCSYTTYEEMIDADFDRGDISITTAKEEMENDIKRNFGSSVTKDEKLKEMCRLLDLAPIKAIVNKVCKKYKTSLITGLDEQGVNEAYDLCKAQMKEGM